MCEKQSITNRLWQALNGSSPRGLGAKALGDFRETLDGLAASLGGHNVLAGAVVESERFSVRLGP